MVALFFLCPIIVIAIYFPLFKKEKISIGKTLLVAILSEANFIFWSLLATAGILYLKWESLWATAIASSLLVLCIRIAIGRYIFRKFSLSSKIRTTTQFAVAGLTYLSILAAAFNYPIMGEEPSQPEPDKISMLRLSQVLQMYYIHNNKYPTSNEGLDALIVKKSTAKNWRGPYIENSEITDSNKHPFQYNSDGKSFTLRAAGKDEVMNTEDDIVYPEIQN